MKRARDQVLHHLGKLLSKLNDIHKYAARVPDLAPHISTTLKLIEKVKTLKSSTAHRKKSMAVREAENDRKKLNTEVTNLILKVLETDPTAKSVLSL